MEKECRNLVFEFYVLFVYVSFVSFELYQFQDLYQFIIYLLGYLYFILFFYIDLYSKYYLVMRSVLVNVYLGKYKYWE